MTDRCPHCGAQPGAAHAKDCPESKAAALIKEHEEQAPAAERAERKIPGEVERK